MKKMTGIFALLCAISCMTGCGITNNAASTASSTAAQTTAATTVSSAAAVTVSFAASQTAAATTASSAAAQTTAAATASSAAAKTTAAQKNDTLSYTVSGHIWFTADDIITEYAGKKLSEGIVTFRRFQCSTEFMTLPLDVCSKMQKGQSYTIEFKDAKITEPVSDSCLYTAKIEGKTSEWCEYGELLSKYAKLGTVRAPKDGEQGLDRDEITWNGLPADAKLHEWVSEDLKPETFTAEFVDGYFDNPEGTSYDTLVLMRDGKPFLGRTQLDSKKLVPGKLYQFTVTTDDPFQGITEIKPVDGTN